MKKDSKKEDKRIAKTNQLLKSTLITLLDEESFEEITITQLCDRANVSRITFYSHYTDKYELVEDIFNDMIKIGTEDYQRREASNNADGQLVKGFLNCLECIITLYFDRFDFFKHAVNDKNPYLAFSYYNHVFKTVEHHTAKESSRHNFKYTNSQITGFLCYGLLGFITESQNEKHTAGEIKKASRQLLNDILNNGVLF